jgi:hypothetical protein
MVMKERCRDGTKFTAILGLDHRWRECDLMDELSDQLWWYFRWFDV